MDRGMCNIETGNSINIKRTDGAFTDSAGLFSNKLYFERSLVSGARLSDSGQTTSVRVDIPVKDHLRIV
ncbi:hypothetical protein M0804_006905 [Polistes exclamans]|nr:hypothetical protein M0804_006905 [Polistes exclamans]